MIGNKKDNSSIDLEVSFIEILGIPIYIGNVQSAVSKLLSDIENIDTKCISASGAHGLVYSKKKHFFKNILKSFYINLPDGMPGVWIGKLKGSKNMSRCYGPDFFMEMMKYPCLEARHYLCGGKAGVADKLKLVCENQYNANVVGTFCPPFLPVEEYDFKEIGNQINKSNANIVWIGLSTPKQEIFASYLSKHTRVAYICCVGAAFDFHIGNVRQAPSWMQKMALEWFFRLMMEPKRLWRRYSEVVPLFIYYNFKEILSGNFFNNIR